MKRSQKTPEATTKQYGTIKLALKAVKEVVVVNPKIAILYIVFINVVSLINIYWILVMGRLLDNTADFITSYQSFEIGEFLRSDVFKNFMTLIALHLVITFMNKSSGYFKTLLSDFYWKSFQEKIMTKVSGLNLEDMENPKIQKLITQVPSFSWDCTWNTFIRLTDLVSNIISFVSAGYAIATQMSVWGIGIIFFVIPEAFFRFKYNVKIKQFRDSNAEKLKYADYIHSQSMYLNNFPELRVDNVFNSFIKSFKQTTESYYKRQNDIRKKRDLHAFFWSWFDASLKRLMQIMLIPISIAQRYSIGTFKYLYDFIDNIYNSSWNVIWQCLMIKSNSLYVKDYFDLFEYQGFGDIASGNETLDPLTTPRLKFVNVSFQYPESPSAALNNISFTIEPGEKVAIIGRDNSGKSTIAKLLCGLYRVSPGDILIDNISIKNLARGELKNKISIVFENYIKYNFSIRKNITVTEPERDFNRRLYEEALEISEIKDLMDELLIDENQILGKMFGNGIDISTGHRQRLAIARAIYRDRPILILDESFTQIDGFSRRPIMEKIIKHRPKQTFINITQDELHSDLFDRIIYIEDGKVKKIKEAKKHN